MPARGSGLRAGAARHWRHRAEHQLTFRRVGLATVTLLLAASLLGCPPTQYTPPESGPIATISVASTCSRVRADFYARINGLRTPTYGCNQRARWPVSAGHIDLEIQVLEESFRVDPLRYDFEIAADQCADFLLRQSDTYELEVFGIAACPDPS